MKWYNVEEGDFPELDEPVFIAKQPTEDFVKECRLGRLVLEDNTQEKGWFVGNEMQVITLNSRQYWTPLLSEIPDITIIGDEDILRETLDNCIRSLRLFEKKFQKLAACMATSGNGLYFLDYFVSGVLNRSLSLLYGFETLLETANFLAAAHLVRPHLDNYLRLSAAWLVQDPHGFAANVWQGGIIRKMKDRDGKWMTDNYLKEKAAEDYPWMVDVYEATSGFIHFSDKHIANATTSNLEDDPRLMTFIGKVDNKVSYGSKLEATLGMIEISNCIARQVYGWIETKRING